MFRTFRTRVALAVAAAAIVAAGAAPIVPARAAPAVPAQEQLLTVGKPDLMVQIVQVDYPDNGRMNVTYVVKNIGTAATGPVALKEECADSNYAFYVHNAVVGPSMGINEMGHRTFQCSNSKGARVTVGTANDSNLSNNVARVN